MTLGDTDQSDRTPSINSTEPHATASYSFTSPLLQNNCDDNRNEVAMLLKASTPAFSLLHSHQAVITAAFSTSSSASSTPSIPRRCCLHQRNTTCHVVRRRYATAGPSASSLSSSPETPPPSWPSKSHPTPYDIFAMPQNGPYTKKRFYQLVKLYHPDIHTNTAQSVKSSTSTTSSSKGGLTPALRLERYHLIVAANDILSDPNKRHLYDTYGLGWSSPTPNADLRARDRSWRDQPNSPAMNATWEDWERWHAARGDGKQNGQHPPPPPPPGGFYMPNSVFATLVALMCAVGALAQGRRAETAGAHFVDVTAQRHQNVSEEVMRSASASGGMTREERVERFLRDRENVAYQYQPGRFDEEGNWRAVEGPSSRASKDR